MAEKTMGDMTIKEVKAWIQDGNYFSWDAAQGARYEIWGFAPKPGTYLLVSEAEGTTYGNLQSTFEEIFAQPSGMLPPMEKWKAEEATAADEAPDDGQGDGQ